MTGSEYVLRCLECDDPMRYQAITWPPKELVVALMAMRIWLGMEEWERVLTENEYPEFYFLDDEDLIREMRDEILMTLNWLTMFEAIMIAAGTFIACVVGVMLALAMFDGVQKRAYDNKKKWDNE